MKTMLLAGMLCACVLACGAQSFRGTDKSPLDIAWFPDHFAHDRKDGEKALVKVTYSRPARNGRELFGALIPYGKVWRTGANESTEIRFYEDATVAGEPVKAGTYSMFTIPGRDQWTVILNADLDYWGAYRYNEKNDVLRVTAPVQRGQREVEHFTIQFDGKANTGAVMMLAWGDTVVSVPISF